MPVIARRAFLAGLLATPAAAQGRTGGVLVLHGKTGTPGFPGLQALAGRIAAAGMRTSLPEMPWSRVRHIDGPVAKAFDEIAAGLARLRAAGAAKVFIAGHSIGATAALGYAVARGGVDGIAMVATGHVPQVYYDVVAPVRASVERARAMAAAGRGGETGTFADSNQGKALDVRMTAADYLTWFEPGGAMDPHAQIARAPCPVIWAVGSQDGIFASSRVQYFDRLPPDPRHAFLAVDGGHAETPAAAAGPVAEFLAKLV